jgi:hypothetical protein
MTKLVGLFAKLGKFDEQWGIHHMRKQRGEATYLGRKGSWIVGWVLYNTQMQRLNNSNFL